MRHQRDENVMDKVVLVSDYGRSGQGWLSYMLCYVLNAKYIEPYDLLKGRLYSSSKHVLENTMGNLPGRAKSPYSMIVKTHNYPGKTIDLTDKIIMLRRDPRDVAVSAFFRKKSYKKKEGKLGLKSKIHLILHRISFLSYMMTIFGWIRFYEAWDGVSCHNVTYEALSSNTKEELQKMLDYLCVEADEMLIEEAVEIFSFKRITGRQKGEEVVGNSEFRKGVVGDYRNHISGILLKICRVLFGDRLVRQGYSFD